MVAQGRLDLVELDTEHTNTETRLQAQIADLTQQNNDATRQWQKAEAALLATKKECAEALQVVLLYSVPFKLCRWCCCIVPFKLCRWCCCIVPFKLCRWCCCQSGWL